MILFVQLRVILLIGLTLIYLPIIAQDSRKSQAYLKDAQRYESLKKYLKAKSLYRQAQNYATSDASQAISQKIQEIEEDYQIQQLKVGELADDISAKISRVSSPLRKKQLSAELMQLQQDEDASSDDYKELISAVDTEPVTSGPTNSSLGTPIKPLIIAAKFRTPPPKVVNVNMP
jgi:hypothetical protein